jgi:hypothetical protein
MAHFSSSTYEITVEETAKVFLQGVYRLHGLPQVLVSDIDPRLVSAFWLTFWRVNSTFHQILRILTYYDGSGWVTWLPQFEFAYNASRALGIEHTPFEANYGFSPKEPPSLLLPMRPSILYNRSRGISVVM